MLNYSGYYNRSDDDIPSESSDLFVKSCGHYKLLYLKKMQTVRTGGRRDYQLLYVAEGTAHFVLDGICHDVGKGGVFIYKPMVPQDYYYILPEKPDIRKRGKIIKIHIIRLLSRKGQKLNLRYSSVVRLNCN